MSQRIYLDNAATSWPKPETVYHAVDDYQRRLGAPSGRGTYREALEVDQRIEATRHRLARMIDAGDPRYVVWAFSGTDAIHLALHAALRPHDHVVTTVTDHNAVLRPLRYLEQQSGVEVTRVGCNEWGYVDAADVLAAVRPTTRLVAISHASNVTGALQPVAAIGEGLRGRATWLLVDAAQTLGHVRVSVRELGCHLLAAPAHKGLFAPTGTGFLWVDSAIAPELQPVRLGGTGTSSDSDEAPAIWPQRMEAGNLNVPGLLGLQAGLEFLDASPEIGETSAAACADAWGQLAAIPGIHLFGPPPTQPRVPVVSFQVEGYEPQEVAALLEQMAGIQVRAGYHCAPHMHAALKTALQGGTIRLSWGAFNQARDTATLVACLRQLAGG